MGVRQRWFLTAQGVHITADELARPIPWQVTETGLKLLVRRLVSLELFYAIAPGLWLREDVQTPHDAYASPEPDVDPYTFTEDLTLIDFQWMRTGDLHAVARYDNRAWVPMIWVGSMVTGTQLRDKAANARRQLDHGLDPAGWVICCNDYLGELQAVQHRSDSDTLVTVGYHPAPRRMAGSAYSSRYLTETSTPSKLGNPEAILTWLNQDSPMMALNSTAALDAFWFIAQWPAATPHHLETHLGPAYRSALRPLRRAGLVVRLDGSYYLDRGGILEAARMDRVSWQSVASRCAIYLREDGAYRRSHQPHDRAVVDVGLAFDRRRLSAYAGWRDVRNIPGGTQIQPDHVAFVPDDAGQEHEIFIEVEFTARAPGQIINKIGTYRLYHQHTGT